MPTESKWEAPAATVIYLSTELNTLADGGNDLGAKVDNVADGENEMFLNLEFYKPAQAAGALDADARIEIYILYSVDDTYFDMGADGTDPRPEALLHVFSFATDHTANYYRTAVNLPIAPFDFKLLVMNETGQVLASTLNTLKYRLHSAEAQ